MLIGHNTDSSLAKRLRSESNGPYRSPSRADGALLSERNPTSAAMTSLGKCFVCLLGLAMMAPTAWSKRILPIPKPTSLPLFTEESTSRAAENGNRNEAKWNITFTALAYKVESKFIRDGLLAEVHFDVDETRMESYELMGGELRLGVRRERFSPNRESMPASVSVSLLSSGKWRNSASEMAIVARWQAKGRSLHEGDLLIPLTRQAAHLVQENKPMERHGSLFLQIGQQQGFTYQLASDKHGSGILSLNVEAKTRPKSSVSLRHDDEATCAVHSMNATLRELNLEATIAHPPVLAVNYCGGTCPSGRSDEQVRGKRVPEGKACCIPASYKTMTVVVRRGDAYEMRDVPNILVDSCKCVRDSTGLPVAP